MPAYIYEGNVSAALLESAREAFAAYKADKEPLVRRIRDNERFYRAGYSRLGTELERHMVCDTPFIFSAIENARADAVDNFPGANILAREPQGAAAAQALSKIVPAQLEISEFRRAYKDNMRNKLKYGTAVYGVFYSGGTIDIRTIDILDIYVDMHVPDIQDSRFLFIRAAVENDYLREEYPQFAPLFGGDADVETLTDSYRLRDRTLILDCYYKKPDGKLHMLKLCGDTVIAATEDMDGYENGLYSHGLYPVVFDVLYPTVNCPFGFGMIDIGKATQVEINKLDSAVTENIMCGAKPRYLAKRSGGIDEGEFRDLSRSIVHYEGDSDAIKPIDKSAVSEYYLLHRERKKEELKEILGNRDFQQGATSGGVTAASAIETLRQTGEKRSRAMINDTYEAYRKIVYMMLELMRQFFTESRVFRVTDESGARSFCSFSGAMMYSRIWDSTGAHMRPLVFDIDVVPQRESPYQRETVNKTIMQFWASGMFDGDRLGSSVIALKNMSFDGKEQLIADLERLCGRNGITEGDDTGGGLRDEAWKALGEDR